MLKKFTWIAAALLATLAMAFFGCTDAGLLDDGSGPRAAANPIVDGAKYLEISKRVNGWDSLDIRAGKAKNLAKFTEGATHTITIYGKTVAGTKGLYLGNTDSDYGTNWGYLSEVKADGQFTIKATVPWDKISDPANNKRISIPTPPGSFLLFEVIINDGTKDLYKLSEDKEIQDLEDGDQPFPDDTVSLTWWVKAGTPTIKVVAPSAGEKVKVTFDPDGGTFLNPNAKERMATEGAKIGQLPTVKRGEDFFLGWFDVKDIQYTADTIVPNDGDFSLKAKWGGADSVARVGDTIVHSYPKLTGNSATDGWEFQGTVNADGSAKYTGGAAQYVGGRTRYTFPLAKLTPLIEADEEDLFNVVEFTFDVSFAGIEDDEFLPVSATDNTPDKTLGLTLKAYAGGDVNRYPLSAGNAYVDFKEGTTTFKVAISDIAGGAVPGLDLERRNKGPATIKLLKVTYLKGTVYTVTFDAKAQVRATNVEPQKILAEMKASAPTKPNWYDENFVKVTDFLGWYDGDKLFDFGNTLIEKDIDLVSKWKVAYKRTVTLNLGGGTLDDEDFEDMVQEFATVVSSAGSTNPDRSEIDFPDVTGAAGTGTFAGWVDRSVSPPVKYHDGTSATTGTIDKDVTLTAVWNTTITVALSATSVATSHSWAGKDDGSGNGFGPILTNSFANNKLTIEYANATGFGADGSGGRQAAFILLTAEQVALLKGANEISMTLDIDSSTTIATGSSYRLCLANKDSYDGWDASNLPNISNFSGTSTYAFTKSGKQASATWSLLIQRNGAPADNAGNLVINSITFSIW